MRRERPLSAQGCIWAMRSLAVKYVEKKGASGSQEKLSTTWNGSYRGHDANSSAAHSGEGGTQMTNSIFILIGTYVVVGVIGAERFHQFSKKQRTVFGLAFPWAWLLGRYWRPIESSVNWIWQTGIFVVQVLLGVTIVCGVLEFPAFDDDERFLSLVTAAFLGFGIWWLNGAKTLWN